MRAMIFSLSSAALLIITAGCSDTEHSHDNAGGGTQTRSSDTSAQGYSITAMDKAVAQARASWKEFADVLANPSTNISNLSVKRGFSVDENPEAEHLWLTDVTFDGTNFEGVVNSKPHRTSEVKLGDKVTVTPKQLSDWMYVEDGILKGAFTVRIILSSMPKAQQDAYFDSKGYRFEETKEAAKPATEDPETEESAAVTE